MRMRIKVFLALLCAAVMVLGVLAFLTGHRKFPMWEIAEEKSVSGDVVLTFAGLERKNEHDVAIVNIKNEGEQEVGFGFLFNVEYLKEGVWYTVYVSGGPSGEMLLLPQEETAYRCSVPSGLLDTPGIYRIYVIGTGYCEIMKGEYNEK